MDHGWDAIFTRCVFGSRSETGLEGGLELGRGNPRPGVSILGALLVATAGDVAGEGGIGE